MLKSKLDTNNLILNCEMYHKESPLIEAIFLREMYGESIMLSISI